MLSRLPYRAKIETVDEVVGLTQEAIISSFDFLLMIETTLFNYRKMTIHCRNTCDKEAKITSQENAKLTLERLCNDLPKNNKHYKRFKSH